MLETLSNDPQHPALTRYANSLPVWLQATDNLAHGLIRKERALAAQCRYTELYQRRRSYMVLDVDYPNAIFAAMDSGLPTPTLIVENPANRHAHLFYELNAPVSFGAKSRSHPQDYFRAIQQTYTERAGADHGFTHYISKNPLHPHWRTHASDFTYDLGELAKYVELPRACTTHIRPNGEGRNSTLFDSLRYWAYRIAASATNEERLMNQILEQGELINAKNAEPLPFAEVKATCKSVARFCWKNRDKFGKYVGVMGFAPITPALSREERTAEGIRRQIAGGHHVGDKRFANTEHRFNEALKGFAGRQLHARYIRRFLMRDEFNFNPRTIQKHFPLSRGMITLPA